MAKRVGVYLPASTQERQLTTGGARWSSGRTWPDLRLSGVRRWKRAPCPARVGLHAVRRAPCHAFDPQGCTQLRAPYVAAAAFLLQCLAAIGAETVSLLPWDEGAKRDEGSDEDMRPGD